MKSLVVWVTLALAVPAYAATPDPALVHADYRYEAVNVADGITTFIEETPHAFVNANTTLIVGADSALVVDSGHYPAVARRVIADIRKLTNKPVRYLATTHWHMDHLMANADYADAFPGLVIIAQQFTASMIPAAATEYLGYDAGKDLEPLYAMLKSGKGADGKPVAADRRARIETVIREIEAVRPEFPLMRYRGADLSFSEEVDIDLGKRTVKLLHLGRGNTAGDLVAYVPDAKALIAGDLLVHPVPFSYGSYLREWAVVLRKLAELKPTTIVPGHGPVMRDTVYLNQVRLMLEAVVAEVERVWKPGMSADQVRGLIDISRQRDIFCHGDKGNEANFTASIEGAGVDRIVQQLAGNMKPEGLDE